MKLAFVVPWYGPRATGGAEMAVRRTAEALYHRAGLDVEVLTTCSAEFDSDWGVNELPAGLDALGGVPVRRFPVRPRDARIFGELNARLLQGEVLSDADEETFAAEMIHSDALYEFIRAGVGRYFWMFTPYMFGTTWTGSSIDPDHSALIPALHDECYAYLGVYAEMFGRVRGIAFHSRAEMELGRRLYALRFGAAALIPDGVEPGPRGDGAAFRARHGLGDYLLYVGRKDPGKNLPLLLDCFDRYVAGRDESLSLVLLGKGTVTVPPGSRRLVRDLGFVSEQEKQDAYAGALALCQPSLNESFSLVMMEAWLASTPCLVHADCAVTREHCVESNGGLYFSDAREFAVTVDLLREAPATRATLGTQGRTYVQDHFRWDGVIARYLDALRRWGADPDGLRRADAAPRPVVRRRSVAVHQLLTNFRRGDAISNHASALREVFRSWGLDSDIFAGAADDEGRRTCGDLKSLVRTVRPHDVLVYHHSIHSDAADAYLQTPARRVLVYHNVTPSEYFASRHHRLLTDAGRAALPELIRVSERLMADSTFNASELTELGAARCEVVPILVDARRLLERVPDPGVSARLGDGRVNLLFVGRIVRNKMQRDVIEVYRAYRHLNPAARLVLVGTSEADGGLYLEELRDMVRQAGIPGVVFTGGLSDAELLACYRTASVFVCMSEHEGFCVPIVEAMALGVPVVAYAAAAVPETMGGAGVLVHDKDVAAIAREIDRLVADPGHRASIVDGQRRRLAALTRDSITARLRAELKDLLEPAA